MLRTILSQHRIFVQRLAAEQTRMVKNTLLTLEQQALAMYSSNHIIGTTAKNELRRISSDMVKEIVPNLKDIAEYEASFIVKKYQQFISPEITAPVATDVSEAAIKNTMTVKRVVKTPSGYVTQESNGKSIDAAYKQFARAKADEIHQALRDAQTMSLTKKEFQSTVNSLIYGRQLSQATILNLTSTNHVTNIAKEVVMENNKEYIEYEQWVADLELNTCSVCEDLNGEVRPAGEFEQPPLHWGCNCEVIPYAP